MHLEFRVLIYLNCQVWGKTEISLYCIWCGWFKIEILPQQRPIITYTVQYFQPLLYFKIGRHNLSPPGQHGRHFAPDICKYINLNENVWILLKISLKFVPKVRINNILALA